jgi:hypothetical protein
VSVFRMHPDPVFRMHSLGVSDAEGSNSTNDSNTYSL